MTKILMTDIGHDPDDAIALSYLIEHNWVPDYIIISPGFPLQVEIAYGICCAYNVNPKFGFFTSKNLTDDANYVSGKHSIFTGKKITSKCLSDIEYISGDESLIIGPATNIGKRLECTKMVFQGGYSPNSINPLPKFKGIKEVQSFNPSGAKEDFNLLLKSSDIIYKRYVGKNVCHGYTNSDLRTIWEPSAKKVSQFWNMLKDKKAMHDVLAAQCMLNPAGYEWENAKPIWINNKMSTHPTEASIYSLIGIKNERN